MFFLCKHLFTDHRVSNSRQAINQMDPEADLAAPAISETNGKTNQVFGKRMSSAKVLPKKKLTIKSGLENVTESMTTPYQLGDRNPIR